MKPEIRQVLRGLAHNRLPGFNFPGNFLELSFDEVSAGHARLSIRPGPHCTDREGHLSLPALGLLADVALATPIRQHFGSGTRMATVSLHLQFTGTPAVGMLTACGRFDGLLFGARERQGLSRLTIQAGGALVCSGSGAFIVLGGPNATPSLPMRRAGDYRNAPLNPEELTPGERDVLARAEGAMDGDSRLAFIERFMGLSPRRTPRGAMARCANGLHIGNRVGHVQGGISLALAAATATHALGDEWMMSNVSAWYVGPGIGREIEARSRIVHLGTRTAVVQTTLTNDGAQAMLQVTSGHARRTV